MKRFLQRWGAIAGICFCAVLTGGAIDQTTKDALKVKHILRTIEEHPARTDGKIRSAEVTEKEVNAYIAYMVSQEKNTPVNRINVDLFDNNLIGGKIRFDAERLNLSAFLDEDLDFDFKGILHTRNGAARVDFKELRLYGQPVSADALDSIVKMIPRSDGGESGGIGDWYEMPKGVKRIETRKGIAVLHY